MGAPLLQLRCYLAEWYEPELIGNQLQTTVRRLDECVRAVCATGSSVQLVMVLAVPDDEMVFGIFAADSQQVVDRVCRQAGIPAQRLSPAIDARAARQP